MTKTSTHYPSPYRSDKYDPKVPNPNSSMAMLLNLPGEIRNHIYRYTLVSAKPFIVKLQFFPKDTALFRVNRQVYAEASTIFYHENVFHFPQSLFDGEPVLEKLEYFIRLPRWRLATLKNFKLDFPVYRTFDDLKIEHDVLRNTRQIADFILNHCSPGLKVLVDFGVATFFDDARLQPTDYWHLIYPWFEVQRKILAEQGEFEVIARIHPQHLNEWPKILEKYFEDRWFIVANVLQETVRQRPSRRLHSALVFSDGLHACGLRDKYDEVFDIETFMYTLSIRRGWYSAKAGSDPKIVQSSEQLVR
ncbi:hypothetical protein G7Y79_00076g099320 [Physcia stellaris]|nr:hypothetical protein G7Y79_00076g099320 [Physcia stellaris]